jgi:glycosyltransferase involved in cell wall biosynthesis
MNAGSTATGIVVIGRNEGIRLVRCLDSLAGFDGPVVYVDSGSTDDSVAAARARGVDVVVLTADRPFTAARGRNTGFARLMERFPGIERVQFVDGDCEVHPDWLPAAEAFLRAHPDAVAVTGRRRERAPEATPYNRLADLEWDTPIGETGSFGGDVMIRASAFDAVTGYDETLIAGEDPDLAFRLCREGGRIFRVDAEMTLHDADMHRFGELWRRQVRAGHAFVELLRLHGRDADPDSYRSVRSILVWGAALPVAILALAWPTGGASLALLGLYGVQGVRIALRGCRAGRPLSHAALYAGACVVGKLPEARGVVLYGWNRFVLRRRSTLIEYKGASPPAASDA